MATVYVSRVEDRGWVRVKPPVERKVPRLMPWPVSEKGGEGGGTGGRGAGREQGIAVPEGYPFVGPFRKGG